MDYQDIFQRYEIKYLVTREQKELLLEAMAPYIQTDEYGRTSICNLYFDTPDYRLVRHSLERPVYKEKLRLRSYGRVSKDGRVFAELKKKYKGVVYKRRIGMEEREAMEFLLRGGMPSEPDRIAEEISYFKQVYAGLAPRVYLSYEREAFRGVEDEKLRITFDENILWRQTDLSLCAPIGGTPILEPGASLMEVKVADAMPLWLCGLLSENGIFKTCFSKYGRAYVQMWEQAERARRETGEQTARENLQSAMGGRKYA
ncbi:MAG: polyphosphate polymerase domain-containing protein [Clostridium sp.]|nr:polyphosphate polymerase domain-containing protein [Acetatifactor muris]MCM1527912.1 polyphosphate polymerase domain-containing protein [Bacteroides sp.]MCM1564022.1 polyphosphate polymerase domain-containing protein [Clostridium sp.]